MTSSPNTSMLGAFQTLSEQRPHHLLRYAPLMLTLIILTRMNGQSITNGNFESGSTGWSGCIVEIGTAPTYGGSGTGYVAEVDGNFSTAATDDRILCQTITGFTVGSVYKIDFDATRRGSGTAPTTVSVTMTMDGALNQTITRTGGYLMVHGAFTFTATLATHAFRVTPNFEGSHGMLFDNIALSLVSSLPIELLYFDAVTEGTHVDLSWATASETNNDFFTVQRSSDGVTFEGMHNMAGAGQSLSEIAYADIDATPLPGLSYYRLQQTDFDGTTTVSDMVPVRNDGPQRTDIVLFPNPASEGPIWLSYNGPSLEQGTIIAIMDAAGRQVFNMDFPLGDDRAPVDISAITSLVDGAYTVGLRGAGRSDNAHLIIEGN